MLYAQINPDTLQMIGRAQTLPQRFTTAGGATINGFDTLPQAALFGLGWVPVVYETIGNPETHRHGLAPVYDGENRRFVFPAVARDLDTLKAEARAAIDQAASDASARHITQGVGQESRYLAKAEEAAAYLRALAEGRTPDLDDYPFLQAEATACGRTIDAQARYVADTRVRWMALGAAVEAARMGGKTAVAAAETAEATLAARDTALAALEAI
ncbi:hypothetical protein [Desulfuromonas thiophila]|uniref:Uncharacterized protein n=1 Tax=Desulfuromonas thiophila TaxID=57664 RepID=A0A1G7B0Y2_9BACT|nr:hypothetical protein [Desulfuromonas thiophila]SDE20774.1 hypothetical protein SAMN05661003_10511 [Desulfuromonas thiophila]